MWTSSLVRLSVRVFPQQQDQKNTVRKASQFKIQRYVESKSQGAFGWGIPYSNFLDVGGLSLTGSGLLGPIRTWPYHELAGQFMKQKLNMTQCGLALCSRTARLRGRPSEPLMFVCPGRKFVPLISVRPRGLAVSLIEGDLSLAFQLNFLTHLHSIYGMYLTVMVVKKIKHIQACTSLIRCRKSENKISNDEGSPARGVVTDAVKHVKIICKCLVFSIHIHLFTMHVGYIMIRRLLIQIIQLLNNEDKRTRKYRKSTANGSFVYPIYFLI